MQARQKVVPMTSITRYPSTCHLGSTVVKKPPEITKGILKKLNKTMLKSLKEGKVTTRYGCN